MTQNTSKSQLQKLAEDFPAECLQVLNKGGARLIYVPVAEVISRMNAVLDEWSIVSADCWENGDSVIAKVTVEAVVDGSHRTHIGFGGQKIKFAKSKDGEPRVPVDIGDEYKGAMSDAFKKAAQQLGVGLSLARKEEAKAADNAADPDVIRRITAYLTGLEGKARDAAAEWVKENVGKRVRDVNVDEADLIVAHFGLDGPS